jgi:hypothetical protein
MRKYHTAQYWKQQCELRKTVCGRYLMTSDTFRCEEHAYICNKICYVSEQQLYWDYSGSPSWHRNLYDTKPARRQEALALRKIIMYPQEADTLLLPLARKPFTYYW